MALPLTESTAAALPLIPPAMLQEGDMLLCRGTDLASILIEIRGWPSHVMFASLDPRDGEWGVIQATEEQGVAEVPLDFYSKNYGFSGSPYPGKIVVARIAGVTPDQAAIARNYGLSQRGAGYDTEEIVSIAAHILARLPTITPTVGRWICSGLAWAQWHEAGIDLPVDPRGYVGPSDLPLDPRVSYVGRLI
jgi:hypothetical protein